MRRLICCEMLRFYLFLVVQFLLINSLVDANQILFFNSDYPSTNVSHQQARFYLIFPGTKWCGPGNIAKDYDDLGTFPETDKCCRAHDNCDCLTTGRSKEGLTNLKPFTVLDCKCDKEFYDCLQASEDDISSLIGDAYFLIQSQCYRKDYPIKSCKQYEKQFFTRCIDYNLDTTQEQKYQWFDLPFFSDKPYPSFNETEDNIVLDPITELPNNEV